MKATNGWGQACGVLYKAANLNISMVALHETRRAGRTNCTAVGFRVSCCGSETDGQPGVGLVIKESICIDATYTTEYIDERLMAFQSEISEQRGRIKFTAYEPLAVVEEETKQRSGVVFTIEYRGSRRIFLCMYD